MGYRIGHSYFCPNDKNVMYDKKWFEVIIKSEIEPLLKEYWFDNPQEISKQIEYLLS